jgi:uncharacterized protein (DUF433 family)
VRELHDGPHLEGRRITVRFIKEQIEDRGLTPSTIADRNDPDVADVHRALTHQYDHPEEIRAVERQRETAIEEHEHRIIDRSNSLQFRTRLFYASGICGSDSFA